MKKLFILITVLVMASALFAGSLIDEATQRAAEINSKIAELGLPWKAGVSEVLEEYEAAGISSLDSLINKWAGTRDLPEKARKDMHNYFFNDSATTRDAQLYSTEFLYFAMFDTPLPSSFIQIHTPVRDQGFHGTCWAFATVASFESALQVQKDGLTGEATIFPWKLEEDNYDLSEQFVAFHDIDWDIYSESWYDPLQSDAIIQDSNMDVGGNQHFSTYNSIRYGIPQESDFPYSTFDLNPWISWNPTNNSWEENLIRSTKTVGIYYGDELSWIGYPYQVYINSIKEAIIKFGALGVSYSVPADFNYYVGGIYIPTTNQLTGGHAVTLVGWLDMDAVKELGWVSSDATSVEVYDPFTGLTWYATEFWVIKNSWSPYWGWNGYYVVPMVSEELYDISATYGFGITPWMIEYRMMYVPLFEENYALTEDIDFNDDGDVDEADYQLLMDHMFTYDSDYDISIPRDGYVDHEDVTRFLMIWNDAD